MNIKIAFHFFVVVVLLWMVTGFTACVENRIYEKNIDIKEGKWFVDSVLVFDFEIKEPQKKYNFFYNIRNSLEYPFYNMYVTFYLENAKGEVLTKELQNITLMDSKTGEPFGSGLGDMFSHQLSIPRLTNYQFPDSGKYVFKIEQYMRRDPLPEIYTMGVRIENAR